MNYDHKTRTIDKDKLQVFSERLFALTRGSQNMIGRVRPEEISRIMTSKAFQLYRFWETEVFAIDKPKLEKVKAREEKKEEKKAKASTPVVRVQQTII